MADEELWVTRAGLLKRHMLQPFELHGAFSTPKESLQVAMFRCIM